SWLLTTMTLWSCGVNEGAPAKVIFWMRRSSDCTTSAKANWRGPRCSTSILRQWPNSWKGRSTQPKTLFDQVTLSRSDGIPYAAFDGGSSYNSTDCEHVISQESHGRNTIITLSITACFHGTFEGTWVGTERDVIHADGSGTGQGS